MTNFKILLKKNFLEFRRSKKWIVYVLVFSLIALISSLTAKYLYPFISPLFEMMGITYDVSIADAYGEFIANMSEIGYLLITIMFSTSLIKEKSSNTYDILKSNGVNEKEIVLAHYVSKLILITVTYVIGCLVFFFTNLILFQKYTGFRGITSLFYIYLMLVFALSFALFISSFLKKNSHGFILSFVSFFAFSIISVIPHIDIFTPLYSLVLSSEIITVQSIKYQDYIANALSIIVLSGGLIISSIYLFKNRINNVKVINDGE